MYFLKTYNVIDVVALTCKMSVQLANKGYQQLVLLQLRQFQLCSPVSMRQATHDLYQTCMNYLRATCLACLVQNAVQVKIGTDVAASEFYSPEKKHYDLDFKNPTSPADPWPLKSVLVW